MNWMHISVCERHEAWGALRADMLEAWRMVTPCNVSQVTVCILTEDSRAQRSDSDGGILDMIAGC